MNTKKFGAALLLLVSAVTFSANAAVTVSGKLIEESTNEPLEYANVVLLMPDSAFIAGTVSAESGIFKFEKVEAGNYLLKFSYLGFDDRIMAITVQNAPVDVGTVIMSASTTSLNEVVVTAKQSPFKASVNGGFIADVATSLLSSVGTANDVLKRIPGVIDDNGAISVFGKGAPIVYINNRKVRDMSELERLESSEISTVELITNPGAKYDAEGRAVLLIKTKTKINGLAMQATERLRQGKFLGDYENISLSYTRDRLNLFTSFVHRYNKIPDDENHLFIMKNDDGEWRHESNIPNYFYSNNSEQISAGFDYSLNEKHAIGGQYQYYTSKHYNAEQIHTATYLNSAPYETSYSQTATQSKGYQHLVNAFYNADFSEQFSLHFDFDYMKNHDYSEQRSEETVNGAAAREVDIYSQTDYDLYAGKLTNGWKTDFGLIEFGGEYNNINGKGYVHSGGYSDDSDFSNTEQKAAGFASYSQKFAEINVVAGLRYEYTSEYFTQGSEVAPFLERRYSDWYPNLAITGRLKNADLSLTFNKRTKRPTFSQLNGSVVYINRFIFQKGNPYLSKENNYTVAFQAIMKPFLLSLDYTYTKNPIINTFQEQKNNTNGILSTYDNFPKNQTFTAMLSFNHTISFWLPNYTVGVIKPYFKGQYDGSEITFDKPFAVFNAFNDFTLPKGFVLSCNFTYFTPPTQFYMEGNARKQLDFGLRKSLFNNSLRFNLYVYDVFNWQREYGTLKYNNMFFETDKKHETRYATLSITYILNSYKKKYRGENAAKDDLNRF